MKNILINAVQVLLCTHKVSGDRFAAKKIEKQHLIKTGNTKYAVSEREVLTTCQHPNIIKLFYSFRDTTCLCTWSAPLAGVCTLSALSRLFASKPIFLTSHLSF